MDGDQVAYLALGLAVAAPAAAGLVFLWRARLRLQADLVAKDRQGHLLTAMLENAPEGYYLWSAGLGEPEICSPRLAVLLDLPAGVHSRFEAVRDRLDIRSRTSLDTALAGLRSEGQGFVLDLSPAGSGRTLQATGRRLRDSENQRLGDILWIADMSADIDAARNAVAETARLTAERDRLRNALYALPAPVWVRGEDLALVWCNRAYASAADAISPQAAVDEGRELISGAKDLAERARAEDRAVSESHHVVIDGLRRLLHVIETPLPGGGAGFALDLSGLEEAEDALERHRRAHALVLENLGTAIAVFGTDTRLSFYNAAYARLWGLDDGTLAEKPAYTEILEILRSRRRLPETADFAAYRTEELRRFADLIAPTEDLLHLPDGRTLRRTVSPHPLGGLLLTYEDVTDRLALERSYNTSIAVQRATLDHLHEGVAVFGGDGRLALVNPAFAAMWNLPSGFEAGTMHASELIDAQRSYFGDAAQWSAMQDRLASLIAGREVRRGRFERADGSVLDYAALPLPDGASLLTFVDATDSVRVERALRERNDALAAANRLKSEFISNVSYEVRAPLTTALGFSEILLDEYFGKLNARQKEYLRGIHESAGSLAGLIDDILDLAAIEAGRMTLELDTQDIPALLASVLALVRERARRRKISLNFDCPADIGWIVADGRRLKQVLFNLTSNAVKFTQPGGHVTLAALREGDQVIFTVADTGIGIPPADQSRMFHSFARGSSSEARQSGAGLGLSLVKSFVELHGGRVEIVSVPGEGTTVSCILPAGRGN